MAINKTMRKVLKALSAEGIEVKSSRQLANLKSIDPLKVFYNTMNYKIYHEDYPIPIRIYLPEEELDEDCAALLFFHGGGWVTDSLDNYERICARMAEATHRIVISVEYRLAPEYPFPTGLNDCYTVAKAIYTKQFILNVKPENVTMIGDSAGANLAAALSLMARDKGEFLPKKQILIYPAVGNDYSEHSPFPSVHENGTDYGLTVGKMRDYINLYVRCEEDKQNPYFAPILAENCENQPDTLILTAEFDLLRDEGEAYGRKLKKAGNKVRVHRLKDAFHGFFALGIKHLHVQECFEVINRFLEEV